VIIPWDARSCRGLVVLKVPVNGPLLFVPVTLNSNDALNMVPGFIGGHGVYYIQVLVLE
jgi:hypothetical protein